MRYFATWKGNGKMINIKCEICGEPAYSHTRSGLQTKGRKTRLCKQCDKKVIADIKKATQNELKKLKKALGGDITIEIKL